MGVGISQDKRLRYRVGGLSFTAMGATEGLGKALLLLRGRRQQAEVARGARITPAMLSRYENEVRSPQASTLGAVLDALGASVYDLADALAQVNGRAKLATKPRQEIITALRGVGLSDDALRGAASMSAAWGVPLGEFVASVAEAARQRAQEIAERFEEPKQ